MGNTVVSPSGNWAEIILGGLALFAAGVAIAWPLFQILGIKWLENRFSQNLEKMKHDQNREIEALRSRISLMLDHSAKLSSREFDVLPIAWGKVFDAFVATTRSLAQLRSSPDFTQNDPKALEEFLDTEGLSPSQREKLRSLPIEDRTKYFIRCGKSRDLHAAKVAAQDADFYLAKSGLFLEEDVHTKLSDFMLDVWEAISAHELAREMEGIPRPEMMRQDDEFRAKSDHRVKELERFVRARFWRSNEIVA
jgi:hypothetical protein